MRAVQPGSAAVSAAAATAGANVEMINAAFRQPESRLHLQSRHT